MTPLQPDRTIGLLDAAPDAILIVDQGGQIVEANIQAEQLFGCPRNQLLDRPVHDLLPDRFRSRHARQVAEYFKNPIIRTMGSGLELSARRVDGREVPVEISLCPVSHHHGLLVVAAIRDVSDSRAVREELRKSRDYLEAQVAERTLKLLQSHEALRRENERSRRILDVAGVMLLSVGPDERVRMINPAGAQTLGRNASEIVGTNWFDVFIPKSHREETRAVHRDLLAGRIRPIHRHENPVIRSDGSHRIIAWHNTVLSDDDGGIVSTLSSGADVTEQLQQEKALREQESLARLGEMAAVIAHEIKNPLAAVIGALQVVRDDLEPKPESREILVEVIERLDGLAATVSDLLDFARPRSSEPVDIPVSSLLESTMRFLRQDPSFVQVPCQLVCQTENAVIRGDVQQFTQLFHNLLANAAQAMNGSGRVMVTVSDRGDEVAIDVRDEGPGIPTELRDRVFEPFFTTRIRGTGLGLPTARRITELHGGRLEIADPADGGPGVVLRVTLPRSRPPTSSGGPSSK